MQINKPASATPTDASTTATTPTTAQDTPQPDKTYALLHPDGTLEWRSSVDEKTVREIVGGHHGPGAVTTSWLGPAGHAGTGALRLMASDLCLTQHYQPNETARRVITGISQGYVTQRWGGVVALVEFERDPTTGEVYFPQPMSQARVRQIGAFYTVESPA